MDGINLLFNEIAAAFEKAAGRDLGVRHDNQASPMEGTKKLSWGKAYHIVCTINVTGLFITGYDIIVTASDGSTCRTFEDIFVHVPLNEEERSRLLHLIYWAFTWIQAKEKPEAPDGADTP